MYGKNVFLSIDINTQIIYCLMFMENLKKLLKFGFYYTVTLIVIMLKVMEICKTQKLIS